MLVVNYPENKRCILLSNHVQTKQEYGYIIYKSDTPIAFFFNKRALNAITFNVLWKKTFYSFNFNKIAKFS